MYRSRRTWLMVQAILAYVAIIVGGSGWLVPSGLLNQSLNSYGEAGAWGIFFCSLGVTLMSVVIAETLFRKKFERMVYSSGLSFSDESKWPWHLAEMERRVLKRFAEVRKLLDFFMAACWAIAFALLLKIFMESEESSKLITTMLLAPAWIILHIRGGWEHVKVCKFRPQFDRDATFVGFVGNSIRRGAGGSKG